MRQHFLLNFNPDVYNYFYFLFEDTPPFLNLDLCVQGRSQGGARGICPPPFFPESCNIYHFLRYKYQHQVVAVVFGVKSDHRKADYKAISKQTLELCFDRAVSGLEFQEFAEIKGHKNGTTGDLISGCGFRAKNFRALCVQSCPLLSKILATSLVCTSCC